MEKLEEAYDIGYEDYFYSGNYCFIEWADKAEPLLPSGTLRVNISTDEYSGRILEVIDEPDLEELFDLVLELYYFRQASI